LKPDLYILAGGDSRRFGSDKARADVGGRTLLEHVATALTPATRRVHVVSAPGRSYDDLGFETIFDRHPGVGPLGGLEAALHHATTDPIVLAPCDLVDADPRWVEALRQGRGTAPAAAFLDERWHPVFGLFTRDALWWVDRALAREEHALWRLMEAMGAAGITAPPGFSAAGRNDTLERN